jgi:hypothetical protein
MENDFERGKEAAMNVDYYNLDSEVAEEIIESENSDFMAGWNSYFQHNN